MRFLTEAGLPLVTVDLFPNTISAMEELAVGAESKKTRIDRSHRLDARS